MFMLGFRDKFKTFILFIICGTDLMLRAYMNKKNSVGKKFVSEGFLQTLSMLERNRLEIQLFSHREKELLIMIVLVVFCQ